MKTLKDLTGILWGVAFVAMFFSGVTCGGDDNNPNPTPAGNTGSSTCSTDADCGPGQKCVAPFCRDASDVIGSDDDDDNTTKQPSDDDSDDMTDDDDVQTDDDVTQDDDDVVPDDDDITPTDDDTTEGDVTGNECAEYSNCALDRENDLYLGCVSGVCGKCRNDTDCSNEWTDFVCQSDGTCQPGEVSNDDDVVPDDDITPTDDDITDDDTVQPDDDDTVQPDDDTTDDDVTDDDITQDDDTSVECVDQKDCPNGTICIDGVCMCDPPCIFGKVCIDYMCVDPPADDDVTSDDDDTGVECTNQADCPPGNICWLEKCDPCYGEGTCHNCQPPCSAEFISCDHWNRCVDCDPICEQGYYCDDNSECQPGEPPVPPTDCEPCGANEYCDKDTLECMPIIPDDECSQGQVCAPLFGGSGDTFCVTPEGNPPEGTTKCHIGTPDCCPSPDDIAVGRLSPTPPAPGIWCMFPCTP